MIPLWMFPMALTTGNTMVLKPSEQDPGAAMMLVELAKVGEAEGRGAGTGTGVMSIQRPTLADD